MAVTAQNRRPTKKAPHALDRFGDPLPTGAHLRLGTTRFRFERDDFATNLSISRDGSTIAAIVGKLKFRCWDAKTGKPLHTIKCTDGGHGGINSVALSRDGTLVVATQNTRFEVFDVATGEQRHLVIESVGGSVAFTRDGSGLILPPTGGHPFRLYDLTTDTMRVETTVAGFGWLAVSADGHRAALAIEGDVAIYDADTLERIQALEAGGKSRVVSLAFDADDRGLTAIRLEPKQSNHWPLPLGESRVIDFPCEERRLWVPFSLDGRFAVVIANDDLRHVIDLHTGATRLTLPRVSYSNESCAFAESRMAAKDGGAIRVFDLASFREDASEGGGHVAPVGMIQFEEGGVLASYATDAMRTWNIETGAELASTPPRRPQLIVPAHGVTATWAPGVDTTVSVSKSGVPLYDHRAAASVKDIAVSPTTADVAYVDWRGNLVVRTTSAKRWSFQAPSRSGKWQPLMTVAYSQDGTLLAAGGDARFLALFNASTGKRVELAGHTASIERVVFHPTGKLLFSRQGRTTKIWDTRTGADVGTLKALWPDAWSPDGRLAATIEHTSIVLWAPSTALPAKALAALSS